MTSDLIYCEVKGKRCDCYFACKYTKHRFNIEKCNVLYKQKIDVAHKKEVIKRKELLNNIQETRGI